MAYPNSGIIKIYPATVQILSGQWALNSDGTPQPSRNVADLQAYYDLRTGVVGNAPCARRNIEFPALSGTFVPDIATYELQFFPSTIGIEFYDGSYPSPVVATHDFLDAAFPMGMTFNFLNIWWMGETLIGPNRNRTIDTMPFKYAGASVNPTVPYTPGTYNGQISVSVIPTPLVNKWSFIRIMRIFGINVPVTSVVSGNMGVTKSVISECFMTANYNTQTFSTSTDTPNALPGDIANVNGSSLNVFDENQFRIYWDTLPGEEDVPNFPGWTGGVLIPRKNILQFTASTMKFIMPNDLGIPYGGRRLMLTGTSDTVFFEGEFPLQNYNVTLVDSSGLYTLIPGKRNDTYYDRSVSPVVTTDLKIPDPRVKSGFFNA